MDEKQLVDKARAHFGQKTVLVETEGYENVQVFMDGIEVMSGTRAQAFEIMGNNEHTTCTLHDDDTAICWEWSPEEGQVLEETSKEFGNGI
tara:strand:+ start:190 stop:462 length:273 start_codon:yes stop_codon:yes gene_type:complete